MFFGKVLLSQVDLAGADGVLSDMLFLVGLCGSVLGRLSVVVVDWCLWC